MVTIQPLDPDGMVAACARTRKCQRCHRAVAAETWHGAWRCCQRDLPAHGFTCRLGLYAQKYLGIIHKYLVRDRRLVSFILEAWTERTLGTCGWPGSVLIRCSEVFWFDGTNNYPPHAVSYHENLRLLLRVFTCLPESKLDVVGGKKLQSKTSLQNTNPRARMYPKGFGGQPEQVGEEAPGGMHGNWAWCVMITPFPVPFAGTVPHRGFLLNQWIRVLTKVELILAVENVAKPRRMTFFWLQECPGDCRCWGRASW